MANLELQNLNIHYGDFHAVKGMDIKIGDGEIVTLLGPSGCGKTSMLRSIAGFIHPSEGKVVLEKEDITYLPPQKRDMGMIFQNYALWPHMTVKQNILYGLKIRNTPKEEMESVFERLIKQVKLQGQEEKFPGQLSGGQQQRVALARALAISPQILLCDEPLSNLDFELRVELRTEIRDVAKRVGVTVVYVTHDQTEALAISDIIAVINLGELQQLASPVEIYNNPFNYFVGKFVGENNLMDGKVVDSKGSTKTIEIDSGDQIKVELNDDIEVGEEVDVIIRTDKIFTTTDKGDSNIVSGKVGHVSFMGNFVQLVIFTEGEKRFMANVTDKVVETSMLKQDTDVLLNVDNASIFVFNKSGDRLR